MEVQTHLNDPRLRRVRSLSLGLRVTVLTLGGLMAVLFLFGFLGIGATSFEGISGYRVTLVDFEVRTRGVFVWQDLALLVVWLPLLALGVAIFQQTERMLASYQRGVILDAGNARRISRIGLFIVVFSLLLTVADIVTAGLYASLFIPQSGPIVVHVPWILTGLVVRAIGYAMGIACEIAEDAELTV